MFMIYSRYTNQYLKGFDGWGKPVYTFHTENAATFNDVQASVLMQRLVAIQPFNSFKLVEV